MYFSSLLLSSENLCCTRSHELDIFSHSGLNVFQFFMGLYSGQLSLSFSPSVSTLISFTPIWYICWFPSMCAYNSCFIQSGHRFIKKFFFFYLEECVIIILVYRQKQDVALNNLLTNKYWCTIKHDQLIYRSNRTFYSFTIVIYWPSTEPSNKRCTCVNKRKNSGSRWILENM